jgi:hypothetical protein
LAGTQTFGNQDFRTYSGSDWTSYSIPVGEYFTGDFAFLVLAADKDTDGASQESFFRNITFREGSVALQSRIDSGNQIGLSPNPASFEAIVRFDEPTQVEQIQIFDVAGKLVKTTRGGTIRGDGMVINVQELPEGVYYLKVRDLEGNEYSKRMVVQRQF